MTTLLLLLPRTHRVAVGNALTWQRRCDTLEACRGKWRNDNQIKHEFDGSHGSFQTLSWKCKPINEKVRHCLKWKRGDMSKYQEFIGDLKACMAAEEGVVATPTEGDKIWSGRTTKARNKSSGARHKFLEKKRNRRGVRQFGATNWCYLCK